ncbi:MAG: hypothetical protein SNJ71_00655 [Bacteroidales bacterium]
MIVKVREANFDLVYRNGFLFGKVRALISLTKIPNFVLEFNYHSGRYSRKDFLKAIEDAEPQAIPYAKEIAKELEKKYYELNLSS